MLSNCVTYYQRWHTWSTYYWIIIILVITEQWLFPCVCALILCCLKLYLLRQIVSFSSKHSTQLESVSEWLWVCACVCVCVCVCVRVCMRTNMHNYTRRLGSHGRPNETPWDVPFFFSWVDVPYKANGVFFFLKIYINRRYWGTSNIFVFGKWLLA